VPTSRMKRILVTGASGFIGNACIDVLAETSQYETHAISTKPRNGSQQNIFWHQLDLHDHLATRELLVQVKPTHLLHLAWHPVQGKIWSSEENYKWVNTSFNLLQAFALSGGKRCIIAGSCAEYSLARGICLEDQTPLESASVYGKSKNALHSMQESFCKESGLSCAWGRVFYLYGPHEPQQKLTSSVILSLLEGKQAKCSHGNQIRDYLFVQDAATAFIALLESEVVGAVNIASGKPLALKEIILKVADKLDGHDLVLFGALTPAENEPDVLVADINRLSKEVGWKPEYSLDRGLDLTIEWCRKQLDSKA